ncbi:MAG TPA: GspE/PulE family protein [Candidatus Paceibacterota bacterium]|nr:GspE/PulE family protein [Candidatus Paceibacterota bacterium]
MRIDALQLKNFLLDTGLIPKKELESLYEEVNESAEKFADALLASGKISEDDLRRAKAYLLGIPFVDLKREKIAKEILSLIPEPVARKHNIVVFRKGDRDLEVAMLDPEDLAAIDFIKKGAAGLRILPRLTDAESIKNVLLQYQKSLKAEFGDIIQRETATLKTSMPDGGKEAGEADLKKMAEDMPVVRIVDSLLSHANLQKASDIHIEPYENEVVIRYRIDGLLHDAMILPKETAAGITARIKVLANLRLDEKRLPQDGRFKIDAKDMKVSFRVSTLPTYFGEKIVMRLLPDSTKGFSLEAGGFHGEGLERIHQATRQSTGMILVTGPTGSGKTTTLYTILEILNTPDVNISTVEDPIEYQMPRVNQTQIRSEIGLTFANGLRALVRQDPDIIMVGEIRDRETIQLAINASLTGHLVLSTLHTNSAAATIPRMLDMGAEPFLVVSTVNVIIAQRLVRRLAHEKEECKLSSAELKQLAGLVDLEHILKVLKAEKVVNPNDTWQTIPFYKPKPTAEHDGFSGRVGIHEVMKMSSAVRELIIQGATADKIEQQAKQEGMLTMLEDGVFKAAQGLTTVEEVLRVISE